MALLKHDVQYSIRRQGAKIERLFTHRDRSKNVRIEIRDPSKFVDP